MIKTSGKLARKAHSCSETAPDQAAALTAFLDFVRRNRAAILSEIKPLAFCLSLADAMPTGAPIAPALALLRDLTGDVRDYAISSAYALFIGPEKRKRLCAYFTPPSLAAAAMEAASPFIVGRNNPFVLDPACGGGSFLVPAARRLTADLIARGLPPQRAAGLALQQIHGIELDPDLAAISCKLLANVLRREYGFDPPPEYAIVHVGDALVCDIPSRFDLVVGNPPYGRIYGRASPVALVRAGRANLGGHTNLYSLFLLRALDAVKPGGGLVFVLPTSFIAGPYFAGLREEIIERADVLRIDLHEQRDNLFVDAVQDVCLLTLRRRSAAPRHQSLSWYDLGVINPAGVLKSIGSAPATPGGEPWTLPVTRRHVLPEPGQARLLNPDDRVFVIADVLAKT